MATKAQDNTPSKEDEAAALGTPGVNNAGEARLRQDRERPDADPNVAEDAEGQAEVTGNELTQWGWEQRARKEDGVDASIPSLAGVSPDHDADYQLAGGSGSGGSAPEPYHTHRSFFGMPDELLESTQVGRKELVRRAAVREAAEKKSK